MTDDMINLRTLVEKPLTYSATTPSSPLTPQVQHPGGAAQAGYRRPLCRAVQRKIS